MAQIMIIPINYTSPTSFTDLEMDWSDESTDISCQKSKYLDALRLAILERQSVLNITSLNNLYTSDYIPYPQKTLDSDLLIYMHNAIRTLIPYFVNHTINNGNFIGLDSIPMWNERDILDYLEIADYQYPQPYDMDNTEWIRQQYRIINLLRCVSGSISNPTYIDNRSYLGRGFGSTLQQAVDDAIAKIIETTSFPSPYTPQNASYAVNYNGTSYSSAVSAVASKLKINKFSEYLQISQYYGIVDIYILATKVMSGIEQNSFNSAGVVLEGLNYIDSTDEISKDIETEFVSVEIGAAPSPIPTYPPEPGVGQGYQIGWGGYSAKLICKYTGQNGFKFRGTDW